MCVGIIWLRTRTVQTPVNTVMNLRFYKMQRISRLAEELLASQNGPCSVQLVIVIRKGFICTCAYIIVLECPINIKNKIPKNIGFIVKKMYVVRSSCKVS